MINGADKCIYSKFINNEGVIICLFVDYLLIFGTNLDIVHDAKCFLPSIFAMKDLSEENIILGIKILRDNNCITLLQSYYAEKILKKFIYFNMSSMSTLFYSKVHLIKNHHDNIITQDKHAQIISSLTTHTD